MSTSFDSHTKRSFCIADGSSMAGTRGPFSFLFVLHLSLCGASDDRWPVISTDNGAVRGEEMFGEMGNRFYSFRGIPYVQPPTGELRFKPPVPKTPWTGILNATADGQSCPQGDMLSGKYMGSEDCLYLNVYTPTIPGEDGATLLDVVVNFHGGGFRLLNGSSIIFGPERFPLDEALLVSFNYRLGILGFLSTNDSTSPGNYGLLDQVEALRWIRRNIRLFGGDPDKVTIMGDSAGSASVIYQMLSPLSQGLFRRVIAMSGSPVSPWALQRDPLYWAQELAKELHCPTYDPQVLVACLHTKSPRDILQNANGTIRNLPFVPVVDHYFIDDTALHLLENKKYPANISLMIGTTKDEMYCIRLFRPNISADYTKDEILTYIGSTVDQIPNNTKYVERVWNKYLANVSSFKASEVFQPLANALSDGTITKYVARNVKIMSDNQGQGNTYYYVYDFHQPFANSFFFNGTEDTGVCHGSDLLMIFYGLWYNIDLSQGDSKKVKEKYQKLFINFVKYGNPTPTSDENDACDWPPVQPDKLHLYHIDVNCSVEVYDEKSDEFYNFWNYELYNDSDYV